MDQAELSRLRDELVDRLVAGGHIRTDAVQRAFRAVPRHLFVPEVAPTAAYQDDAIVTQRDAEGRATSSSSQPAIMALMLEQLGLRPGHRVLEIGAGTGYNAALIAYLVGPEGLVVTADIDSGVAEQARRHLDQAGYQAVQVVHVDGAGGWPDAAPYDRVVLTVGAWDLAPAWIEQLADDGRLLLPLSLRGVQRSVAFDRAGDHLVSVSIVDCGFMPMRGALAGPILDQSLAGRPGVFLELDGGHPVDGVALSAALDQPGEFAPTGVAVTADDIFGGLGLWLVLHDADAGLLTELYTGAPASVLPAVIGFPGMAMTIVLAGRQSLAALVRLDGQPHTAPGSFDLGVCGFGPDGVALANRLAASVRDWAAQGRPATAQLSIAAYPRSQDGPRPTAAAVIDKPHARLVLDWT